MERASAEIVDSRSGVGCRPVVQRDGHMAKRLYAAPVETRFNFSWPTELGAGPRRLLTSAHVNAFDRSADVYLDSERQAPCSLASCHVAAVHHGDAVFPVFSVFQPR